MSTELTMKSLCEAMTDEELEVMLAAVKREAANRAEVKTTLAANKILDAIKKFENMGGYFEVDLGDGDVWSLNSKDFQIRAADKTLVCIKY